jgi:hypothetical protein
MFKLRTVIDRTPRGRSAALFFLNSLLMGARLNDLPDIDHKQSRYTQGGGLPITVPGAIPTAPPLPLAEFSATPKPHTPNFPVNEASQR